MHHRSILFSFLLAWSLVAAKKHQISLSENEVTEKRVGSFDQSLKIRLKWTGGSSTCTNCTEFGGSYYDGPFACDYNNIGNWDDGTKNFSDPIPEGSVVTQVDLSIVGRFNCKFQSDELQAIVTVNQFLVSQTDLPVDPKGCICPQCVTSVNISSGYKASGWGFYNYMGINNVALLPSQNATEYGICLAYIEITLFYSPATPQVTLYTPEGGPITGGTLVTIFGSNLQEDIQYQCLFGNQAVNATPASGYTLTCVSPPMPQGNYTLAVLVVVNGDSVQLPNPFLIYEEPKIISINPTMSQLCDGNRTVMIQGSGFVNLDSLRCFWGADETPIFGKFINSTTAWCFTPQTEGLISIAVSENGQQKSNSLNYICRNPSPPPNPPHGPAIPGWAWIILIFGGATLLVIIILTASRRCTARKEDPEDALTRSSLLNPDGSPNIFVKKIELRDIKLLQKIGKGTFGEVFKGIWNGTEVGVKFLNSLNTSEQFLQDFYKEVLIMRSLRHPNVLQFLGACTNPPDIFIVLEYMPMGSLFKILHDENIILELELLKKMIMDAAKGMNYLHKSDPVIIHRDLKSHNLLVDENWKVKVCDFGLSKIMETQSDVTAMTACGTPSWTAPEILRNEKYTEKADVYSFGIVLWECMSREDPYYGMPPFQVVLAVGTKGMRPTIPPWTPNLWKELIVDCWGEQPNQRPSFEVIMERIEKLEGGKQRIQRNS